MPRAPYSPRERRSDESLRDYINAIYHESLAYYGQPEESVDETPDEDPIPHDGSVDMYDNDPITDDDDNDDEDDNNDEDDEAANYPNLLVNYTPNPLPSTEPITSTSAVWLSQIAGNPRELRNGTSHQLARLDDDLVGSQELRSTYIGLLVELMALDRAEVPEYEGSLLISSSMRQALWQGALDNVAWTLSICPVCGDQAVYVPHRTSLRQAYDSMTMISVAIAEELGLGLGRRWGICSSHWSREKLIVCLLCKRSIEIDKGTAQYFSALIRGREKALCSRCIDLNLAKRTIPRSPPQLRRALKGWKPGGIV